MSLDNLIDWEVVRLGAVPLQNGDVLLREKIQAEGSEWRDSPEWATTKDNLIQWIEIQVKGKDGVEAWAEMESRMPDDWKKRVTDGIWDAMSMNESLTTGDGDPAEMLETNDILYDSRFGDPSFNEPFIVETLGQ